MAPLNSRAGPQQSSKDGPTQFRSAQTVSYVPAHLRGIDSEEEPKAPLTASQSFPLPIVKETPSPAPAAPAPRITVGQDTDAEAWARKMGLLPEISPQSQVPTPQQNQASGHVQKLTTKATNDAPAQSKDGKVAQNAPFNNTRFHLKEDSSETFQDYIQRSTVTNGKKYTFNHSSPTTKEQNAPINTQPSSGAASRPHERREISHQQLHQQQRGTRASGGCDVPAAPDNQQLRLRKVRKQLKHLHGVQPPSQMHNFLKPNLLVGVQFQLLSLSRFNIRVLGFPPLNSSSNALLNPQATSSNWVTTILRIDSRPPSRIPI
jgi:hypothetical protein